jgi:hypothetical protein
MIKLAQVPLSGPVALRNWTIDSIAKNCRGALRQVWAEACTWRLAFTVR